MQKRVNDLYHQLVNKGLIMAKFGGTEQAMRMMIRAGLPRSVIKRVLSQAQIRSSDWH